MHIEETPNPLSLKLMPEVTVVPDHLLHQRCFFVTGDLCLHAPLAKDILAIKGIQGVFLGKNFVTITRLPSETWDAVVPHITAIIEHYIAHKKDFIKCALPQESPVENDITRQIKAVITERIKPALTHDGGDVEFISFEEGTVYVKLLGACLGCPGASVTLHAGMESILKHFVPEVQCVKQIF